MSLHFNYFVLNLVFMRSELNISLRPIPRFGTCSQASLFSFMPSSWWKTWLNHTSSKIITLLFVRRDKRSSNTHNTHFRRCFHVTSAEDFFAVLVCSPMPDKYVERYGPVTDVSRQPVPRPLSRPVKRRTSTEDDGQKKKGWFGQFKAEALGLSWPCLNPWFGQSYLVVSGRRGWGTGGADTWYQEAILRNSAWNTK